jgi:hypothetical protein
MNKRIDITSKNNVEHKALMAILYSLGWVYASDHTYELAHQNKSQYKSTVVYPNKRLGGNTEYCHGASEKEYIFSRDIAEILDILAGREITITNVGDYNAIVSRENVQVGCQVISHNKVIEIYEAIQKIKG